MKILIRPHDIGKGSPDWLGKNAFEWGFDGVQLAIAKAVEGQNGNPGTLTKENISQIESKILEKQSLILLLVQIKYL